MPANKAKITFGTPRPEPKSITFEVLLRGTPRASKTAMISKRPPVVLSPESKRGGKQKESAFVNILADMFEERSTGLRYNQRSFFKNLIYLIAERAFGVVRAMIRYKYKSDLTKFGLTQKFKKGSVRREKRVKRKSYSWAAHRGNDD
jgi:hypothetical protein